MQKAPGGSEPRRAAGRGLRIAVPLTLIGVSLWLLVGCLYIPTGENVHLTGSKKDFRSLPGYDAGNQPRVAGRFTRERIEAFLGRPGYGSDNGRRVMYVLHASSGVWIMPLCFSIRAGTDETIGLVLRYDDRGTLQTWQQLRDIDGYNPIFNNHPPPPRPDDGVLDLANEIPSTQPWAWGHESIPPRYPDPWALKYKR
jgi:hypothetical protein